MASIKIIKKEDGYAYKYDIIGTNNKTLYVSKSGFKTPESALEAAKKSYNRRMSNKPNPIHIGTIKHTKTSKKKETKPIKIKNFNMTDAGCVLLTVAVYGAIGLTLICNGKIIKEKINELYPNIENMNITDIFSIKKQTINPTDCDFSNLYIIIRTAEPETYGVGAVTSEMLTRLGVSNEVINENSDLETKISNAISNNPNDNIVILNLESGLENTYTGETVILSDCSNNRKYPSDILAVCINESLKEYSLNPTIKGGHISSGSWRLPTDLENELSNASLINSVSQLTIDLPTSINDDEIIRNDAAASIVEGIIRWTSLDTTERYKDIYYSAKYGDTGVGIAEKFGVSYTYIEENSNFDIYKGVTVGDALLVGYIPDVAKENVTVYNPYTTTDITKVEPLVTEYTVQSGDTLTKIANMYGVKVEDLVTASGDPNNIKPGEIIYISTYNKYQTHEKLDLTTDINENKKI